MTLFVILIHFEWLFVLQIYACEQSNWHSGTLVFLLGQLLSSIPFVFLISISSSLVFYFLVGLRDHFSLLMYFVLNFFACLLVNEGLVLVIASICQDIFWSILILLNVHVKFHPTWLLYEGKKIKNKKIILIYKNVSKFSWVLLSYYLLNCIHVFRLVACLDFPLM